MPASLAVSAFSLYFPNSSALRRYDDVAQKLGSVNKRRGFTVLFRECHHERNIALVEHSVIAVSSVVFEDKVTDDVKTVKRIVVLLGGDFLHFNVIKLLRSENRTFVSAEVVLFLSVRQKTLGVVASVKLGVAVDYRLEVFCRKTACRLRRRSRRTFRRI